MEPYAQRWQPLLGIDWLRQVVRSPRVQTLLAVIAAATEQVEGGAHRAGARCGRVLGAALLVGDAEAVRDEPLDGLAQQVPLRETEDSLGLAIDQPDASFAVGGDHGIGACSATARK